MEALERLVAAARGRRGLALVVANLRILIGFAFFPAGLKKLIGEPFTDPQNTGPFHDFLHAFHATGWFYNLVGVVQLVAATLLMTQRFALAGAALALPVLSTIMLFCWSTQVYPTATVVTLMWLGTLGLLAWDLPRWRALVTTRPLAPIADAPIAHRVWELTGLAVIVLYVGACVAMGEIYRPRGAKPSEPGFWLFPGMLALVVAALVTDLRRARR